MFDSLATRLGATFDKLTRHGSLTEGDVSMAMREVRVALLEADVALPVVKQFIDEAKAEALGAEVLKSVTPGQQVIKIVNDHMVKMLGGAGSVAINLAAEPPAAILMVGLQGSGKTTTSAKLAKLLKEKEKKRALLASLDTSRPAAMEQLAVLGQQVGIDTLPIVDGEQPVAIAKRAMKTGRQQGYDIVILDTAGRLHADAELMDEVVAVRKATNPVETLLVADALTGQDAVNVATQFKKRVEISGIILTRVDGDGRGGAALSMRAVTGCPIKVIGVGEKLDALEPFHPERIASRILGMGDVVSLVEKAQETIDEKEAENLAKKVKKGGFDLNDLSSQLNQMRRMGGMDGLLGMLPGVGKIKRQMAEAQVDEKSIDRMQAIISSMTGDERSNPKRLNGSRKRRIATGSGTSIQDVNRLLKQFKQMNVMMKRVGKLGEKGLMRAGMPGMIPPR
ncbi:MAG: signal recognition particle protein [Alphaproteobacteria bacterium]